VTDRRNALPDEKQSQIKLLIARGKEQGYLTYAEVNDHLPDDIVDPEQIEDIVNTINDMGITVYEKAPDAEELLLADTAVSADDDDTEEAAAALASVDSEFGRTTDPVRMYMREMGTVELLTREGEIRIAKRIEEGLEQVRHALSEFPGTHRVLLKQYAGVEAGEVRLAGPGGRLHRPRPGRGSRAAGQPRRGQGQAEGKGKAAAAADDDDEEVDEDDDETAAEPDTGPDPAEVNRRMKKIARMHKQVKTLLGKEGAADPKTRKARGQLTAEFMQLKLSPKLFDELGNNLRDTVATSATRNARSWRWRCGTPACRKKDFLASFPQNETSPEWIEKQIRAKRKHSARSASCARRSSARRRS
jgi:RNA polymerase primary sigma factor